MKEVYQHEFTGFYKFLSKTIGLCRVNRDSFDFKWGYFAPGFAFRFIVHRGGYFDRRWAVTISPGWGTLHVKLPFGTRLSEGCSPPRYGIAIHSNTFWLYIGGEYDDSIGECTGKEWITWDLPWVTLIHRDWAVLTPEGNMVSSSETGLGLTDLIKQYAAKQQQPYTYVRNNGEIQHRTATISVTEGIWSRKWFPFIKKVYKTIDVEFDDEVGERSGSWKGGVLGCSYLMKPGENMEDTLRRMEQDREFK